VEVVARVAIEYSNLLFGLENAEADGALVEVSVLLWDEILVVDLSFNDIP